MSNRVVITGLGVVSSLGMEIDEFWNNIKDGKSGISKIEGFDTEGFSSQIGAEIKEFNPEKYIDRKDAKRMAKFTQYAVFAAMRALEDAGLEITDELAHEAGVLIGYWWY
jgi:3-oxoacyl-[acyl-carrier-protein] synthase II